MALQLDPELPHFWLDVNTLRIGFDDDITGPVHLEPSEHAILTNLSRGISRSGIEMVASQARICSERVAELLDALAPAMTTQPFAARSKNVGIRLSYAGEGSLNRLVRSFFGDTYFVGLRQKPFMNSPHIAIVPARYVLLPMHCQRLMSEDMIHLPLIFRDRSIQIGPIIVPGYTACSRCHIVQLNARNPDFGKLLSNPFYDETPTETSHIFYSCLVGIPALLEEFAPYLTLEDSDNQLAGYRSRSLTYTMTGEVVEEFWETDPNCSCIVA